MESVLKLLLVEDNPGDADLVIDFFSETKLKKSIIEQADNLKDTLALLNKDTFDIILLDLGLPDSSGLTGLKKIIEINPDIPIVVVSGQDDLTISQEAIQQGAEDYLIKGKIDAEILTRVVLYSIERKKQKRELEKLSKQLLESESNLRTLFNAMTDIVFEIDYDGRYINIAPTSPELFIKPPDDTIGKTLHEVFTKPEADIFLESIRKCLNENKTNMIEYPLEIDNKTIWFEGKATPKTKNTVLYISRDITESKQAEEQYKTVVKTSIDGFWINDDKGKIIDVNDAYCEIIGYSREELLKMSVPDIEANESAEETQRHLRNVIETGSDRFETKHQHKNGSILDIEVSVTYEKGISQLYVFVRDITERKLTEDMLTKLSTGFAHLTGNAFFEAVCEDAAKIIGLDYVFIGRLNPDGHSVSALGGYAKGEPMGPLTYSLEDTPCENVIGKKLCYYPHNIQKTFPNDHLLKEMEIESYIGFPLFSKEKQAIGIMVGLHGSALPIMENIKKVFSIYNDRVTAEMQRNMAEEALKESENKLKEINAEKDKFFSIIAHDLKSPLNSIMGFCDLLVDQVQENDYDGILKYAKIILNSSQRAVDLLTNLMEWSSSQTGLMKFKPEYLKIVELCNETVDLLRPIAGQKFIAINNEISPKAIVFADKHMVNTVIRNLISNAIKFTKSGGEINVTSHEKSNELIISVIDSGVGIPKDRIEKLFILSESDSTTGTNKEKGTGLGLILCKEFVKKNGGRIWVESKVGKGSTFYFTLPNNTVRTIENNDQQIKKQEETL